LGKKVLVTGSGPIGACAILTARYAGAAEIVATDVSAYPLTVAQRVGASRAINVAQEPEALSAYALDKGTFDVLFEASGSEAALRGAIEAMRPGGIIVQLGLGGDMTLPTNLLVTKELQLRGTFRFDEEFSLAVDLMGKGLMDVKPLLTGVLPFDRAVEAFTLASDRSSAMKVQLTFD
jgi:L-idonate 5-dehydrogenase